MERLFIQLSDDDLEMSKMSLQMRCNEVNVYMNVILSYFF